MVLIRRLGAVLLITTGFHAFAASKEDTIPRFEVRAFAGMNYAPGRSALFTPRTPPSYGGQVAAAINGWMAAIGTYAYNQAGSNPFANGSGSSIQEWMGGMRFSLPLAGSPVVPYASMSAGKAIFAQWVPGPTDDLGVTHPVMTKNGHAAIAPAIGADFRINRRVGLGVEFRGVKASDVGWYYRLCGSVYFRFP